MKIATLQFSPKLGDTAGNIKRADDLLKNGSRRPGLGKGKGIDELKLDILVLSEMALTGYNFPNLEAVKPYLEEAGMGPCGIWAKDTAKRLGCKVCVGYPEVDRSDEGGGKETYYNSLLVVDEKGEILANYRKTFLYYTDETWAAEGDAQRGFRHISFPRQGVDAQQQEVATSFGICMDINPYRFEAPWTAWEFANRILDTRSQLVILSMAWLTHSNREELQALSTRPELGTFNYWVQRFMPLFRRHMEHSNGLGGESEGEKRMIVVFANRVGEEEGHGEDKEPVRYAGTSAVLGFSQRPGSAGAGGEDGDRIDVKILCWGIMGATEEGICFADTGEDPEMVFSLVKSGQ